MPQSLSRMARLIQRHELLKHTNLCAANTSQFNRRYRE
jgi:hypothetical protein